MNVTLILIILFWYVLPAGLLKTKLAKRTLGLWGIEEKDINIFFYSYLLFGIIVAIIMVFLG